MAVALFGHRMSRVCQDRQGNRLFLQQSTISSTTSTHQSHQTDAFKSLIEPPGALGRLKAGCICCMFIVRPSFLSHSTASLIGTPQELRLAISLHTFGAKDFPLPFQLGSQARYTWYLTVRKPSCHSSQWHTNNLSEITFISQMKNIKWFNVNNPNFPTQGGCESFNVASTKAT